MNYRRTKAIAHKEFLHIVRDSRSLAMALLLPFLLILLFGYGLTLDVDHIPMAVYDADKSPESRAVIARFQNNRLFRIVESVQDPASFQNSLDSGRSLLGLAIPQLYARDLLTGASPQIQLILDGSDSNTASIALGYANSLLGQHEHGLDTADLNRRTGQLKLPAVEAQVRVLYNSELKSRNYVVPGLIAIVLMIISSSLTSLTIAREWELGTMEQLLSTPIRPAELVLGKMAAFFALGSIDTIIAIVSAVIIFRVPFRGSFVFLAVTSGIYLIGSLCWGIFVSSIAKSQLLAYQIGVLTSFLPSFLLSGFIFAIEDMPTAIKLLTYLVPARYFISILKGIFLRGSGIGVLWGEVGFLLALAGIIFFAATRRLNRGVA
jgi:ABC-2 type transport system permease protein